MVFLRRVTDVFLTVFFLSAILLSIGFLFGITPDGILYGHWQDTGDHPTNWYDTAQHPWAE